MDPSEEAVQPCLSNATVPAPSAAETDTQATGPPQPPARLKYRPALKLAILASPGPQPYTGPVPSDHEDSEDEAPPAKRHRGAYGIRDVVPRRRCSKKPAVDSNLDSSACSLSFEDEILIESSEGEEKISPPSPQSQ